MTSNRLRTVALAATFLAGTTLGALAQGTGEGAGGSYPGGTRGGPTMSGPVVTGPAAPGPGVVVDPESTGAIGSTGPGPVPSILDNTSSDPSRPCPPGHSSALSSAGGPSATRC